jgi:hypothetical protein
MSKQIFAAMVAAQKAYGPALKTKVNPHFKNKYADLAASAEAVTDALNANGIALAQVCHESEHGVIVETKFLHESGEEWSGGKLFIPSSKQDAQGFGSALTYARRYSLMAACGIAPEDDDGNAASGPQATPQRQQPSAQPAQLSVPERIAKCGTLDELGALWSGLTPAEKHAHIKAKDARKAALAAREADNG